MDFIDLGGIQLTTREMTVLAEFLMNLANSKSYVKFSIASARSGTQIDRDSFSDTGSTTICYETLRKYGAK